MTIKAGEFWVADIPFTSGGGSKKRPILILWLDRNTECFLNIFSQSTCLHGSFPIRFVSNYLISSYTKFNRVWNLIIQIK